MATPNMLTKFETKSNRVKGLSFHPHRPWVLAALHSGLIQLWDYRIRTLIDKFDEHDGPVRGVCFHHSQPLFVSGGDDYKIKIWNYKQRRCLFTLLGHLDYIRTVQFHHEYPWVLSSSDDQTIRIWNWQSRTSVALLTGHNHYVMCALFHPKEDLLVSASLDQTVRVWDISGLRKRNIAPSSQSQEGPTDALRLPQNELFGTTDAIVKYVLEGHDRGVNWAAFHPTLPLLVSGADDRQVKLWRMNDTKAWEVDTLRGHFNNVSAVLFHPRQELVLSNSEDHTIRVWDMGKRAGVATFRREHDRFWVLAAHPHLNLFGAGHDSGLVVFKLERERPAYCASGSLLFYVKERYLRSYDLASGKDVPLVAVRGRGASAGATSLGPAPKSISYNAPERSILLSFDVENGIHELYQLPTGAAAGTENVEPRRGAGAPAVFVARNRYASLETKSHTISVRNLKGELVKKFVLPAPYTNVENIFPAHTGCLLCRTEDRMVLVDVQQKTVLAEMVVPPIRYVLWSSSERNAMVAFLAKDQVIICNGKLEVLASSHETMRVKSACWDEHGVLLYSTTTHLKYMLPGGDTGIIRTLDLPVYITAARASKIVCIDRDAKIRVVAVDATEYLFKLALVRRRYDEVLRMVKGSVLLGSSIVTYLQKKGFPEVALHFVKDERTRLNLALDCGNIEVALESAKALDEKEAWHRLGVAALRQGNHQVVEMAYQKTKDFERLSFLYLITGNTEKLRKMLKIAEMRRDPHSRMHNSMYLGDVEERARILEEAGMLTLAYAISRIHGLPAERVTELRERLAPDVAVEVDSHLPRNPSLLLPPPPVLRLTESNWPLLSVSRGYFDGLPDANGALAPKEDASVPAAWGLELDENGKPAPSAAAVGDDGAAEPGGEWDLGDAAPTKGATASASAEGGEGWGLDLELPAEETQQKKPGEVQHAVPPLPGTSQQQLWCRGSKLAGEHAAAGQLESAFQLLQAQIGAINFEPLRPHVLSIFEASRVFVPTVPGLPASSTALLRNWQQVTLATRSNSAPALYLQLPLLIKRLQAAYKAFTEGKFGEAQIQFAGLLQSLPLLVVDTKEDARDARELLTVCREYLIGLRMELQKKELAAANKDPARVTELAAYFTHCQVQPGHLKLILASAMVTAAKSKCIVTAGGFARRLLDQSPAPEMAAKARAVAKQADTGGVKDELKLNYDERNPFVVCALSFQPIYRGSPAILCPFCSASFMPEFKGKLCPVCSISQVGRTAGGLLLSRLER